MTNSKAPWLTKGGAIAVLAAAVIALAACGGGGGLNEDEAAGLRAELEAAEASAAAAEAAKRAADTQAAAALAAQQTAEAEAAAAKAAQVAAEAAQAAAEAAQKLAEQTAADDVAAAEAERDRANKAAQDAADAKAAADAALTQARADQKAAEDARDRAQAALATAQQQLTAAQQEAAAQERARLAAEQEAERQIEQAKQEAEQQANVTVRAPLLIEELTGATVDDAGTVMGVQHMRGERRTFTRPNNIPAMGSAPSVPGSWASASYSGPRGAVGTDTVYLYTNIQSPGSKAFWKVHGENVAGLSGAASGFTDTPTVTVSGFGTQETELYPGTGGTPDGATTTSAPDTGTDNGRSIGGTYDGYSGTFKCDAACDIAAADGGALTFHGTWTFTASLTAKRSSRQAEQDTEFLYFGIWAYEPTIAASTPDFKWAAGGDATDISSANFDALTGTARFTGGAIGKYALAKVGGRAAKIGTFTATANFTADFDTDDLSGRITEFKEGGSDLGSDWNVFLGSNAATAADLAATGATGTLEAHGVIDGDTATGAWAATLHGSDNEILTDRTKYPASRYPVADVAGVAGWFNAVAGTNAALAGAFGAACTTGTMCAP